MVLYVVSGTAHKSGLKMETLGKSKKNVQNGFLVHNMYRKHVLTCVYTRKMIFVFTVQKNLDFYGNYKEGEFLLFFDRNCFGRIFQRESSFSTNFFSSMIESVMSFPIKITTF